MVVRHLVPGALAVVTIMLVIYGAAALLVVGVIVLLCRLAGTQAPRHPLRLGPPAAGGGDAPTDRGRRLRAAGDVGVVQNRRDPFGNGERL